MLVWKRAIRTPSSERFLALRAGEEVAAVEVHYLPDGRVAGTVLLMEEAGWSEEQVPDLLASLDEDLLPGVDARRGNLTFSVMVGRMLGNYEALHEPDAEA